MCCDPRPLKIQRKYRAFFVCFYIIHLTYSPFPFFPPDANIDLYFPPYLNGVKLNFKLNIGIHLFAENLKKHASTKDGAKIRNPPFTLMVLHCIFVCIFDSNVFSMALLDTIPQPITSHFTQTLLHACFIPKPPLCTVPPVRIRGGACHPQPPGVDHHQPPRTRVFLTVHGHP